MFGSIRSKSIWLLVYIITCILSCAPLSWHSLELEIRCTATINSSKYYTKPISWFRINFFKMQKNQKFITWQASYIYARRFFVKLMTYKLNPNALLYLYLYFWCIKWEVADVRSVAQSPVSDTLDVWWVVPWPTEAHKTCSFLS